MHSEEGLPTYGALSRTAMIFGIPLIPLAMVAGGSTVLAMIGLIIFGGKALWFLFAILPILGVFKTLSANDDKALEMMGYELRCLALKQNLTIFNNTTTILGTKLGRSKNDYCRFFEKYIK